MSDQRVLRELLDNRKAIMDMLAKLSVLDIETLHRRGDQVARLDGYPAGTTDGGGGGPSILATNEAGNDERVAVTGTELAALSKPQQDKIGRWIAEIRGLLDLMATTAKEVTGRQTSINKAYAELTQAAGAGTCEVCDTYCTGAEFDRLRSGYCPKHWTAWCRYRGSTSQPDRSEFRRLQTQRAC